MNRKFFRLVFIVGFSTIILYILFRLVVLFGNNQQAFDDDLPSVHYLSKEDSSLISKRYLDSFKVNEVLRNKIRGQISLITLKQKYSMVIFQIPVLSNSSLQRMFKEEVRSVDRSSGVTYSTVSNGAFSFQTNSQALKPVSEIILTLYGDSIRKNQQTDSLVHYNFLCKKAAIRYGYDNPIDVFIQGGYKGFDIQEVPMSVLFLKRGSTVYFFVLACNNLKEQMPPDLLYDVVSDQKGN
jgi:hypothetical protein